MLDFLYRMKLKLEVQGGVTILCVTEDVEAQHATILKAGLTKLFQVGKKTVLLDLTASNKVSYETLRDLALFGQQAPDFDAQLAVACKEEGFGIAKTRAEAIRVMGTPMFVLMGNEARLHAQIRKLEFRKSEISARLGTTNAQAEDLKSLRKESSELKKLIGDLETQVEGLLKERLTPMKKAAGNERLESIQKTLVAVLEQEGVLPVT